MCPCHHNDIVPRSPFHMGIAWWQAVTCIDGGAYHVSGCVNSDPPCLNVLLTVSYQSDECCRSCSPVAMTLISWVTRLETVLQGILPVSLPSMPVRSASVAQTWLSPFCCRSWHGWAPPAGALHSGNSNSSCVSVLTTLCRNHRWIIPRIQVDYLGQI